MNKSRRSLLASVALGLIAVPGVAVAQQEQQRGQPAQQGQQQQREQQNKQKAGEVIPMDQVPEPARRAIENQAKGGKVDKVEKITSPSGPAQYRAHIDREGQKREVLVTADGKVLHGGDQSSD